MSHVIYMHGIIHVEQPCNSHTCTHTHVLTYGGYCYFPCIYPETINSMNELDFTVKYWHKDHTLKLISSLLPVLRM